MKKCPDYYSDFFLVKRFVRFKTTHSFFRGPPTLRYFFHTTLFTWSSYSGKKGSEATGCGYEPRSRFNFLHFIPEALQKFTNFRKQNGPSFDFFS